MADQFEPGTVLFSLTMEYMREDDDSIDLESRIRINPHCDPQEYATIFIQSLQGILDRMRAAEQKLIAGRN